MVFLTGCNKNTDDSGDDDDAVETKTYAPALNTSDSKYIVSGNVTSKKELGTAYGMSAAANGEWNVQAAAIESAVIGKNSSQIDELTGKTSVTGASITIDGIANCIAEAADYAGKEHIGDQAADAPVKQVYGDGAAAGSYYSGVGYTVALTAVTNKPLVKQATITVAYATFDSANKVVDARFDCIQAYVKVDVTASGETLTPSYTLGATNTFTAITYETGDNGIVPSKLEKGTHYGMLSAYGSSLAEADEQIEYLADMSRGKTAAEFTTYVGETLAGATIGKTDYATALTSAYKNKSASAVAVAAGSRAGVGIVLSSATSTGDASFEIAGVMANAAGLVQVCSIDEVVLPFTYVEVAAE